MRLAYLVIALAALNSPAAAALEPTPGLLDKRVKTVNYNADQVYKLHGFFGFHAIVTMGDDEEIKHIFGFEAGWQIAHTSKEVVIQPREENAHSNLTVLTDKRKYLFDLSVVPFPTKESVSQAEDPRQTYSLRFNYPERAGEEIERNARAQIAAEKASAGAKDYPIALNRNYTYEGEEKIRPFEVWDDGTFTKFRFYKGQPLPAFFVIEDDGTEGAVNKFIEGDNGDTVVVKQIAGQFVLRYGQTVVCIFNETPRTKSLRSDRNTADPELKRVLKETVEQ